MSDLFVDHELAQALDSAVITIALNARGKLLELRRSRGWMLSISDYPTLHSFPGGMPSVFHSGSDKTKWSDFSDINLDGWDALYELVANSKHLSRRFLHIPPGNGSNEERRRLVEDMNRSSIRIVVAQLVERVMLIHGEESDVEAFSREWQLLRRGLVGPGPLEVEVVVPLPLVAFETDVAVPFAPDLRLEPIPESEQLARCPKHISHGWHDAVAEQVVDAATHALVLGPIKASPHDELTLVSEPKFDYDQSRLDLGLQALTIAHAAKPHFGFAQIYYRPLGWATHFNADLIPILSEEYQRRYSPELERFAWNQPSPEVSNDMLKEAGELFRDLEASPPRIRLAARRLHAAGLRDDEEDIVLDACIALEAAVGDPSPSEMTHKIALRTATALRNLEIGPRVTFEKTKQLYGWRSAIVHGGDTTKKRKAFAKRVEGTPIRFAVKLASQVLQVQLQDRLLTAESLDRVLFDALADKTPPIAETWSGDDDEH